MRRLARRRADFWQQNLDEHLRAKSLLRGSYIEGHAEHMAARAKRRLIFWRGLDLLLNDTGQTVTVQVMDPERGMLTVALPFDGAGSYADGAAAGIAAYLTAAERGSTEESES